MAVPDEGRLGMAARKTLAALWGRAAGGISLWGGGGWSVRN